MRIVVTGTRGIPDILGGVETHCQELFPRIAAKGIEVHLIRREKYVHDSLKEYKGVHLIDILAPKKKAFEAIVHTFLAVWEAKRLHADLIHIHAIGPALLIPLARLLGLKVIFTHHGSDYERAKWGKMAKMFLKLGERWGCRYANEVIAISRVIQKTVAEKYGRRDTRLIHNGMVVPDFIEDTAYLEELGLEKGNYILSVGRFVPEKNYHQLIRCFSSLSSGTCRLVLAGDANIEDNYSKNLKQMARKNKVVLTGFIKGKKLHSLLTHAKCFVLPSSHEGLPIALLEAMAYRLPVIVSDIPANMEVGLDEECYFRLNDEQELADKMKRIINKPLQRMEYPMEAYDWDFIAEQTMDVYRNVLS